MKKILLTSAGFENKNIRHKFLELAVKKPEEIKALFIPTAAQNYPEAIAMLPKCRQDLLDSGILESNITDYDLGFSMSFEDLSSYDCIYFCGGNSGYLLQRILDADWVDTLRQYIHHGGIYIGVSAGSIIGCSNLENNLGFLPCSLSVHCKEGKTAGPIDPSSAPCISLTDQQAILMTDIECTVIE